MNIVTSVVVGILIGWVASILKRTAGQEDLIRNVAGGIAGALFGSWLLGKVFDFSNQGMFSFGTIVASLFGAAALLFVMARLNRS